MSMSSIDSSLSSDVLTSTTLTTAGSPFVIVPVLSKTTVSILCALSKCSALLIRMPDSAPLPVPTMMAVGVARPREQGQAITRTAVKARIARPGSPVVISHAASVTNATMSTAGTK